jgi:hydroxypyruvate reductase
MARAVEQNWTAPLEGLVVTRYGHGVKTDSIEVVEAAHPVPDAAGIRAASRMLGLASGLGPDDLALCLISGGGSALLAKPVQSVTLHEKREVTRSLLRCGASIGEINVVRKHLSAIKGGRLAEACHPARVVTLAISDVPGDDPSTIASGPTVPDPSTFGDAIDVIEKYGIPAAEGVLNHLHSGSAETAKPGSTAFSRDEFHIVATGQQALDAAASIVTDAGFTPLVLGDRVEGEARQVAEAHAALALQIRGGDHRILPPCIVLSGGETTVSIRGGGQGGPNTEYLLALGLALNGAGGVWALAADTDGLDGVGDNAGAILTPDSLDRIRCQGLDPKAALTDNDAYAIFAGIGDLVLTGPTRTNINDFRAIYIEGRNG